MAGQGGQLGGKEGIATASIDASAHSKLGLPSDVSASACIEWSIVASADASATVTSPPQAKQSGNA
jgi:hypothetical protein